MTQTAPDAVISARRVSRTFSHDGLQQHVLTNLDLDVRRGEFIVVMGPSGAGKSTLMHVLSGMDEASLGEIDFDGSRITGLSAARLTAFRRGHCGFVFQQIHLLDALSVLDNVLAVGLLSARKRREVTRQARELLTEVGIPAEGWGKFPSMLSGGEAQRVALVRALVNSPAVVFADEPTGQLNSTSSQVVLDLLGRVNRDGQTIMMVTHDLRSALRGDRVVYLRDGAIRGECVLGRWDPSRDDADPDGQRLARLTGFLDEMGW
ncbi:MULTISPECIES: ABC transporter ATP-binding protein [unclassified Luteococcus]|uniref:ABC transporter ATP-binding protein n=1 Tax=unclassified Luteococcus TaxID=2639923 RepID=UPI00313BC8FA